MPARKISSSAAAIRGGTVKTRTPLARPFSALCRAVSFAEFSVARASLFFCMAVRLPYHFLLFSGFSGAPPLRFKKHPLFFSSPPPHAAFPSGRREPCAKMPKFRAQNGGASLGEKGLFCAAAGRPLHARIVACPPSPGNLPFLPPALPSVSGPLLAVEPLFLPKNAHKKNAVYILRRNRPGKRPPLGLRRGGNFGRAFLNRFLERGYPLLLPPTMDEAREAPLAQVAEKQAVS